MVPSCAYDRELLDAQPILPYAAVPQRAFQPPDPPHAPAWRISSFARSALVLLRHASTTRAPLPASAFAHQKPVPELAPVTTQTLPTCGGRFAGGPAAAIP